MFKYFRQKPRLPAQSLPPRAVKCPASLVIIRRREWGVSDGMASVGGNTHHLPLNAAERGFLVPTEGTSMPQD